MKSTYQNLVDVQILSQFLGFIRSIKKGKDVILFIHTNTLPETKVRGILWLH